MKPNCTLSLGEKPNLYDSRVRARAVKVLELADECYATKSGNKELHSSKVAAIFGHHKSSAGQYFRSLFRQVGSYQQKTETTEGWSYTYSPIDERVDNLRAALWAANSDKHGRRTRPDPWATNSDNHQLTVVSQCVFYNVKDSTNSDKHNSGVSATVRSEWRVGRRRCEVLCDGHSFLSNPPRRSDYKVVSGNRCYDWWTSLPSEVRVAKFVSEHGRMYDFDITAAQPTLLLSAFKELVRENDGRFGTTVAKKLELPTWTSFVADPTTFRAALAVELGVDPKSAKKIAQRLLMGGFAARHKDNGFIRDYGWEVTDRILASQTCKNLRADFKLYYKFAPLLSRSGSSLGTIGQQVASRYAAIENQVMSVIEDNLVGPAWFIHDGFFTSEPQDVDFIQQQVRSRLNFNITLTTDFHSPSRSHTPLLCLSEFVESFTS